MGRNPLNECDVLANIGDIHFLTDDACLGMVAGIMPYSPSDDTYDLLLMIPV